MTDLANHGEYQVAETDHESDCRTVSGLHDTGATTTEGLFQQKVAVYRLIELLIVAFVNSQSL